MLLRGANNRKTVELICEVVTVTAYRQKQSLIRLQSWLLASVLLLNACDTDVRRGGDADHSSISKTH